MENSSNRFDEAALTWDDDPRKADRARKLAAAIRPLIQEHQLKTALDFGAGTGQVSIFLANDLEQITLVDTSPGMMDVAGQKIRQHGLQHIKTATADLGSEPWPHRYDLIYTLMTLHHIHDTPKILATFFELLKPGGILCIADLDEEDGSFHEGIDDFDGHNGFDQEALKKLLQKAGFKSPASRIFYIIEGKHRSYPLFFMTGIKNGQS